MFAGLTIFRTKTSRDTLKIFLQWLEFYFILRLQLEIELFIFVKIEIFTHLTIANENCNILHTTN